MAKQNQREATNSDSAVADVPRLAFQASADPWPVATSVPNRLNLAVFPPNSTVYCNRVTVAVPLGTDGASLCVNKPSASINTARWTIASSEVVSGSELDPAFGAEASQQYAKFLLSPKTSADWLVNYPLVFGLELTVNDSPGTSTIQVQQVSGSAPNSLTPAMSAIALDKSYGGFYLQNFIAVDPSAPTVPCTQFGNDKPIQFEWDSNGSWFQILAQGIPKPLYSGPNQSFLLTGGVSVDTTFVLAAAAMLAPKSSNQPGPTTGYETIFLYDVVAINVTQPDLVPNSVRAVGDVSAGGLLSGASAAVSGQTTLSGPTTIGSSNAPLTVNGAEMVQGPLTANGATSLNGGLTVSGATALGSATVNGPLNASSVSAGNVSASNSMSTNGWLSAQGLTTNGGHIYVGQVNGGNGLQVYNSSNEAHSGYFQNASVRTGNYITGLGSRVASSDDWGLATNGYYGNFSMTAPFTHLPTRNGHRVVTSPLCVDMEVHLSGEGKTASGRATVHLDPELSDIVHSNEYKVLVTPTGRCTGLAVVRKNADSFEVEELGETGADGVTFDWLIIGKRPEALGASEAAAMPERLPDFEAPAAPS